jgi:integrase
LPWRPPWRCDDGDDRRDAIILGTPDPADPDIATARNRAVGSCPRPAEGQQVGQAELPPSRRRVGFRSARPPAIASIALAADVDLKVISHRLGHSSISISADLYTHVVRQLDVNAADSMQQALLGAMKTQLAP